MLLVIVLVAGPYLLLFYRKISIGIRLTFISMIEMFILCIMITIDYFSDGFLLDLSYPYSLFVTAAVALNVILIFVIWMIKKINRSFNKTK